MEDILLYGVPILLAAASVPILHRIPRTRGRKPFFHLIYAALCAVSAIFLPSAIQDVIFSPGGVLVVGTLIPIYESIVAVCTLEESDDMAWLQFWVAAGSFSYATEFMDTPFIRENLPSAGEHWFEFEFMAVLWMLLPFTDGAALAYDLVTKRFIAPFARILEKKLEGFGGLILTLVNGSHIYFLWWVFLFMPPEARRFVTVAVGTVYPIIASIVALTTESGKDDTYWLTYWSCYSILFILMDYLENFIGKIPGFYSLCLCATVYLFLPMFNGAEAVFRNVLVPLSGQYENMLLRDAQIVRLEMERKIPSRMRESALSKAASIFATRSSSAAKAEDVDPTTKVSEVAEVTAEAAEVTAPEITNKSKNSPKRFSNKFKSTKKKE